MSLDCASLEERSFDPVGASSIERSSNELGMREAPGAGAPIVSLVDVPDGGLFGVRTGPDTLNFFDAFGAMIIERSSNEDGVSEALGTSDIGVSAVVDSDGLRPGPDIFDFCDAFGSSIIERASNEDGRSEALGAAVMDVSAVGDADGLLDVDKALDVPEG
jgi:hypothetical protein